MVLRGWGCCQSIFFFNLLIIKIQVSYISRIQLQISYSSFQMWRIIYKSRHCSTMSVRLHWGVGNIRGDTEVGNPQVLHLSVFKHFFYAVIEGLPYIQNNLYQTQFSIYKVSKEKNRYSGNFLLTVIRELLLFLKCFKSCMLTYFLFHYQSKIKIAQYNLI